MLSVRMLITNYQEWQKTTGMSPWVSTENSLGGFGMGFIASGVNSDAHPPHKYELSVKLAASN